MNNSDWSSLAQALLNTWLAGLQPQPDLRAEFWRFGAPATESSGESHSAEEIPGFHHLANLLREMGEALTHARQLPVDADELLKMAIEALRQGLVPLQDGARDAAAPMFAWLEAQARPTLGPGREAQRRLGRVALAARAHLDAISTLASFHIKIVDAALGACGAQLGRPDGVVLDSARSIHAWLCASLDEAYRRSALTDSHVEAFAAYFNSGVRLRAAAQQWQADASERWGLLPPFAATAASPEVPTAWESASPPLAPGDMTPSSASMPDDVPGLKRPRGEDSVSGSKPGRPTRVRQAGAAVTRKIAAKSLQMSKQPDPGTKTATSPAGSRAAKPARGSKPAPVSRVAAKHSGRAPSTQAGKAATKPEFDISLFAQARET